MDKSYPAKAPMVVRSIDLEKDVFWPRDEGEEILGSEFPYLSLIGALMYLTNSTRPYIAFAVNLLARHSAAPTKHHWVGGKQILSTLMALRTWVCSIRKTQILHWLDTLMLAICLIPIMPDRRRDSFSYMVELPFLGNRLNRYWWQLPQIILR